jgi:ABC-2 type transport system permease protein
VFPLTCASNVFVDPDTMPTWLRDFVNANPVSHLVTAERRLMDGTATAGQIGWVLLASGAPAHLRAPHRTPLSEQAVSEPLEVQAAARPG